MKFYTLKFTKGNFIHWNHGILNAENFWKLKWRLGAKMAKNAERDLEKRGERNLMEREKWEKPSEGKKVRT